MAMSSLPSSNQVAGPIRSVFSYAMQATMRRAAALGVSANRITLLRDRDGDGIAEIREIFMEGLSQPFGMALSGDTFYVGNTDGVMVFPYAAGADRITAPERKLVAFKPGGHWTRSLLPKSSTARSSMPGSAHQAISPKPGMAAEEGRAAIYELDLATGGSRIFAGGLRNAVGLAWEPRTGVLWTVVNERDGLGDENASLLSDLGPRRRFLRLALLSTWGQTVDDRVPQQDPATGREGDQAGLCIGRTHRVAGAVLVASRHASGLSGRHGHRPARLVEPQYAERLQAHIRTVRQRPAVRTAADILSGFLAPTRRSPNGRPVGVTLGPDGSLLMADDVGDVIWRVTGAEPRRLLKAGSRRLLRALSAVAACC